MKKYKSKSALKHFVLTAIFVAMCQHGGATTTHPLANQVVVTAFDGQQQRSWEILLLGRLEVQTFSDLSNLSNLETVGGNLFLAFNPNLTSLSNLIDPTHLGFISESDTGAHADLKLVDNTPPTITGTPETRVLEGSNYIFTPTGTDADAGDTLTYSVTGNPSWLTIDDTTGTLTGKPPYDASESSPYTGIVISVTDGTETVALDSFDVEVVDFNFPTHVASISNGQNADGSTNTAVKLDGASDIAILGDYAYVTSNTDNGVEILNISNPAIPVHVAFKGNTTKLNGAFGITVVERTVGGEEKIYAYVTTTNNHAVTTLDVTDPANPTITGFIKNGFDADGTTVNANVKFSRPIGIVVLGDYVYVASKFGDSVEILNISTPAIPTHAGSITNGFNADGTTVNANVKLDGAISIAVVERTVGGVAKVYAYVVANQQHAITILDVTASANPTFLGSITDTGSTSLNYPRDIVVVGDYAYVSTFDEGISVLNISDPANISQVGSISDTSTINLDFANSIAVVGNYVYVASFNDNGVAIIDISDPANLIHAGSISDGETRELEGAYNITVVGNYVYVASTTDNGVQILRVPETFRPLGGVVSTNTFSKEEDYRLFPNPVKDILFVKGSNEITSISISNLSGQTVLKGNSASINVRNLSKGIYFAKIVSGEKVVVEKFIKL